MKQRKVKVDVNAILVGGMLCIIGAKEVDEDTWIKQVRQALLDNQEGGLQAQQ